MFIGHVYMGTIGVSGSYQAMKTGYVDEGWAEEHHPLWYDDIAAGKIPAQRSAAAAAQRRAAGGLKPLREESHASCLTAPPCRPLRSPLPVARQAAAARRRGQGQGRRDRRQGGLDRQGRRLPAVPVAGPRRRRLSQERQGCGRLRARPALRRRAATPRLRRSRPVRAAQPRRRPPSRSRRPARTRRPGTATSPPSTKATSAEIAPKK